MHWLYASAASGMVQFLGYGLPKAYCEEIVSVPFFFWGHKKRPYMTEPEYNPLDYLASSWQILEGEGLEYIFPAEGAAWVFEPDGKIHEYRASCRSGLPPASRAYLIKSIFLQPSFLNKSGFIPLDLQERFRLPEEEASGVRYYRPGQILIFHAPRKIHLLKIA